MKLARRLHSGAPVGGSTTGESGVRELQKRILDWQTDLLS